MEEVQQPLKRLGMQLTGVGLGISMLAPISLKVTPQSIKDNITFILSRKLPDYKDHYMPPDPENVLSRQSTDRMYTSLRLAEEYPKTINPESFHLIAQRVSRVATIYYTPSKTDDETQRFEKYCEEVFFPKLKRHADEMKTDFIATLLMFQISGDNNNSVKELRGDVKDEIVRTATHTGETLIGSTAGELAISALRTLEMGQYYSYARLEGPVTIGIHDIEIAMIGRGIKNLRKTAPDIHTSAVNQLAKLAPESADLLENYADLYDAFEAYSDRLTQRISSYPAIQTYLHKRFSQPNSYKDLLSTNGVVDSYQFSRTTVFWAIISELQQLTLSSFYSARPETLEQLALEKTIEYYEKQSSVTGFFLDQINNPKMLKAIEHDAKSGNKTAEDLYTLMQQFKSTGDKIIDFDDKIAATFEKEHTEENLDFQMLTGVALARWLLNDAIAFSKGSAEHDIVFSDSNDLAYHAFLAQSNRESAPNFQLVASRPLHRATLTFAPPQLLFNTMREFISKVYKKVEGTHPLADFKTFCNYFLTLIQEPYMKRAIGVSATRLARDAKQGLFIKAAEQFGAFQNIITPPHCSWMRAFEATAGYIAVAPQQQTNQTPR